MKNVTQVGKALATVAAALFVTSCASHQEPNYTIPVPGLVHCAGINSCRGKAECYTASTTCGGLNKCRGQGWIRVPKKECAERGGTEVA